MRILRVHHLTLGVNDVDAAAATFARLFGVLASERADVAPFGIRTARIALGDDALELASPVSPDNPLARFLQRKGEGFYNLALEVDDLDAAVAQLRVRGARISDPVEAQPGIRSAFIAMSSTHGLSVQLVQLTSAASVAPDAPPATAAVMVAPDAPPPVDDWRPPPEPSPPPDAEPPPAASDESPPAPLDLTPDEWSDVD